MALITTFYFCCVSSFIDDKILTIKRLRDTYNFWLLYKAATITGTKILSQGLTITQSLTASETVNSLTVPDDFLDKTNPQTITGKSCLLFS